MIKAWAKPSLTCKSSKKRHCRWCYADYSAASVEVGARPEQFRKALTASGLTPLQVDLVQRLRMISTFCNAENIPVLDPHTAIRKRHVGLPCYFVYDGHWIAEGIRMAAHSLAAQWRALGLPPWDNDTMSQKVIVQGQRQPEHVTVNE